MKTLIVQLPSTAPISSASLIDPPKHPAQPAAHPEPAVPNRQIQQALEALRQAAEQMQESAMRLFASHREQIIRLSIEIAAKILAKDIHEQTYQMEAILQQALEGIPQDRPIAVRLNPKDLQTCQDRKGKIGAEQPSLIRFIPDPSVRPAECIVESEQGIIEWIIDEHLKRIAEALLAGVQTNDKNRNENLLS